MAVSNWELNLTDVELAEIKKYFEQWQEIQERKKELTAENKGCCETAGKVFGGKASDASKLFKNMQMLYDGDDAEANNISILLGKIRGETTASEVI